MNTATAGDYKVEIVVFENINASIASESNAYTPPKRMKSGSSVWFLRPSLLVEEAKKLRNSDNYSVKHHFSYGIESLPYQESANYTVVENDMTGYVKIYAEQLLFANIDLDFDGFRMNEKRRLKLNEKHFFDHPKFGLILQVSRLEKPVDETPQTSSLENSESEL